MYTSTVESPVRAEYQARTENPRVKVDVLPATLDDMYSMLEIIAHRHADDEVERLFTPRSHQAVRAPSLHSYQKSLTSVIKKPELGAVFKSVLPTGEIIGCIDSKLVPDSNLKHHVYLLFSGDGENDPLVRQARDDLRNPDIRVGEPGAWYMAKQWSGQGFGKQNFVHNLEYLQDQSCAGAIYFTNRPNGKQFTREYFPGFVLDKSDEEYQGTVVVYLPFDNQEAMDAIERLKSVAFSGSL